MKLQKIICSIACLFLISCIEEDFSQRPQSYIDTTTYNIQENEYVPIFDKAPSRTLENVQLKQMGMCNDKLHRYPLQLDL